MGSSYRCGNPNCGFVSDLTEVSGSFTQPCPVCQGEATLVESPDLSNQTLTLPSAKAPAGLSATQTGGQDRTHRTRALSGGSDPTDRAESDDSHKATMSLPDTGSFPDLDDKTRSLPSGGTQRRRTQETEVGRTLAPATIGRFRIQA